MTERTVFGKSCSTCDEEYNDNLKPFNSSCGYCKRQRKSSCTICFPLLLKSAKIASTSTDKITVLICPVCRPNFGDQDENFISQNAGDLDLSCFSSYLDPKLSKMLENKLLRVSLRKIPNMKWCPGIDCEFAMESHPDINKIFTCPTHGKFCSSCMIPKHN